MCVTIPVNPVYNIKTMDKAISDKVRQCKALKGKTVFDIMEMQEFQDNLATYWTQQKEQRKATIESYKRISKQVPAHCIDQVINLTTEQLTMAYIQILNKTSIRPASERKYISQLCAQAYSLTCAQFVVKQFPELEDILIPKPQKAN